MHSKFNATQVKSDGHTFASKKEARVYAELKLLERAGEITNLELKPVFKFSIDGKPLLIRSKGFPNGRQARYTADAAYFDTKKNRRVVIDVKGGKATRTEAYVLRKALVEHLFPGTIIEEV